MEKINTYKTSHHFKNIKGKEKREKFFNELAAFKKENPSHHIDRYGNIVNTDKRTTKSVNQKLNSTQKPGKRTGIKFNGGWSFKNH